MAVLNYFNDFLRQLVRVSYKGGEVVPVSHLGGYAVDEELKPILVDLVKLVMLTDYTKADTKEYLQQRYAGCRSVYQGEGCAVNKNTSKSRINYDLMKLRRVLGEDFFTLAFQDHALDVERAGQRIGGLLTRVTSRRLLDGFASGLSMPELGDHTQLNEAEKENMMEIVRTCSKRGLRSRWSCFTGDMVDYILHLERATPDALDDEDREVYRQLKIWLGN